MTPRTYRTLTAALLAGVVSAAGLLVGAGTANAQPVVAGTFTMSGDPGDYITGGNTYSYDVSAGDQLTISATADLRRVSLSITAKDGDWWTMDLQAPLGKKLAVGKYPDATRAPFSGSGAGIDIGGIGRGCTAVKGSFVVADVAFGPYGYVRKLDATFEQHCGNSTAGLRGRVVINNPKPADALKYSVSPAKTGRYSTLNGTAKVHGVARCNENATVTLNGLLTQVKKKTIIRGTINGTIKCVKGKATKWTATADPAGLVPFQKGKAELTGSMWANDPNYPGNTVYAKVPRTTVTLTRA